MNLSLEECNQWRKNKLVNPLTGRKIQEGKGVYKDLEKACKDKSSPLQSKERSRDKKKSPSPRRIGKKNSLRKGPCQEQPDKYEWIVGKGCHELIKRSPSPKKQSPSPKKQSPKKQTPKKQSPKKESHKKQTPKKQTPKKQTPHKDKISLIDVSPISKIEGPVSVYLVKPTQYLNNLLGRVAPTLLLLGDMHKGDSKCNNCNEKDGCYSLYKSQSLLKYLDEETTKHNINTDLFLELWDDSINRYDPEYKKVVPPGFIHNSALVDTISEQSNCIANQKRKGVLCSLRNIKVHMADTRRVNSMSQKYTGDNLINIFLSFIVEDDNVEKFEKYALKAYPKYSLDYIYNIIESYFNPQISDLEIQRHFFEDPFYKDYSRTLKQLNQLPDKIRESIINLYKKDKLKNDERHSLFKTYSHLHIKQLRKKRQNFNLSNEQKNVDLDITPLSIYNVDLYIIGRMLKIPKSSTSDSSEFSIIYLGDAHIANIIEKLKTLNYYKVEKSFGAVDQNSIPTQIERIKKINNKLDRTMAINKIFNTNKCIDVKL